MLQKPSGTLPAGLDNRGESQFPRAPRQPRLMRKPCLLPEATPELNAMDHLWRHTKREAVGDRATATVDRSALDACQDIIDLGRHDRLRKAGVLSGNFWLTS